MATSTASVSALPQTAPADTTPIANARTQAPGLPGEFQAALATAGGQSAQATATTTEVTDTDDDQLEVEPDATVAGLIGLVNQLQFFAPPVNAAVAQANGLVAAEVPPAAKENTARTRADELLLNSVGGPTLAANAAQQAHLENLRTPENPLVRNATPPAPVARPQPELPAIPAPTGPDLAQSAAQVANTIAVRGGLPNIPPAAPIVVNPTAIPPVPGDLSTLEPVVNATPEATPTAALPAAGLGDRSAMAGEKFAAMASAGAQMIATASPPPTSGIFKNTLDEAAGLLGASATIAPTANLLDAQNAFPVQLPDRTAPTEITNPLAGAAAYNQPSAPVSPTSPASSTATATPVAQVAETVVAQARVLERPGSVEFHMRLDPPELGSMQIRLVARGDEIHGQVLVADTAVRQLLESQLPELRQRLEASGVNVQSFNIATDAGTGGNRNPYREAPEFAPWLVSAEPTVAPRARIGRTEAASTLDVTV
jgi:flagellar hook-length control protein FliK